MTSKQIAADIAANCNRYNAGELSYEDWGAEQERLWDQCKSRRMNELVLGHLGFNDSVRAR